MVKTVTYTASVVEVRRCLLTSHLGLFNFNMHVEHDLTDMKLEDCVQQCLESGDHMVDITNFDGNNFGFVW